MSALALPPNPSLVAIILITKGRRGVKRIFHYPPNPGKDRPHAKLDYERTADNDSDSSISSDDNSSLEDIVSDNERQNTLSKTATPEEDDSGSVSPEKDGDGGLLHGREKGKATGFLGLPEGFDSMLCPPIQTHKKRFELTLGQLVFLGWPVYAKNSEWKKKRRSKGKKDMNQSRKMSTISEQELKAMGRRSSMQVDDLLGETTEGGESIDEAETGAATEDDDETMKSSKELETVVEGEEVTLESKSGPELVMFHVVFVMNPPALEYHLRVDEMYKHVVKKFSRALKWEQVRSNYVQRECEKLRGLKAKHESLAQVAVTNSSLAKAIATVYDYVSTSRIAHVDLTQHLSFSLQIPTPTSISHLPDLMSPRLPGLWLTTATSIPSNDELHTTRSKLASHFALLLLTDLNSILADVSSNPSVLSDALAHYLKASTPTKSFLQISQASGIPLADIHFLASHLVYWRRARAVPPLHQRDIYIVSPNADMRRLKNASVQYAKLFPGQVPPLPKLLSQLSQGSPRPWKKLIPTKMHKPLYMDVLAWLMRGGWVTQLRSYAWVRVPGTIQAAVTAQRGRQSISEDGHEDEDEHRDGHAHGARTSSSPTTQSDNDAGDPDRPSPKLSPLVARALSPGRASGLDSPASQSSARTAIPLGLTSSAGSPPPPRIELSHEAAFPQSRDDASHPFPPFETEYNSRDNTGKPFPAESFFPPESFHPKLILHPTKASGLESRWLAAISVAMEEGEDAETCEAWERCLKYFNGEHALEKIAAREGWKRKKVEVWRAGWARMGVVLEVRGW